MKNEIVTIKEEYLDNENERGVLFEVVEDNGDRLFIEPVECSMAIKPRELVRRHQVRNIKIPLDKD